MIRRVWVSQTTCCGESIEDVTPAQGADRMITFALVPWEEYLRLTRAEGDGSASVTFPGLSSQMTTET